MPFCVMSALMMVSSSQGKQSHVPSHQLSLCLHFVPSAQEPHLGTVAAAPPSHQHSFCRPCCVLAETFNISFCEFLWLLFQNPL